MESIGWVGAVELKQQLTETESKLTAALDKIADLERVRRMSLTVVREWPGLRERVADWGTAHSQAFNDYVAYLAQAVEGRSSELPPPPRAPVADQEYLQEVLLELWEVTREWKKGQTGEYDSGVPNSTCSNCAPLHAMDKMYQILEQAVETEDVPTQVDLQVTGEVKLIIPKGHEWRDPAVHGPSEASKRVEVRRLRCEDDGPEYPDGTDSDGFPGGDERMGLPAQTAVAKPVEGHPGVFTVELGKLAPHTAYRISLPDTPKWVEMEPIPPIDPMRGVIRSEDVNPNWPMGAPKKHPLPPRPRRTEEQEKTFRQLERDVGKLNEMGVQNLEWLRSLREYLPGDKGDVTLPPRGVSANVLDMERRLAELERLLGLRDGL